MTYPYRVSIKGDICVSRNALIAAVVAAVAVALCAGAAVAVTGNGGGGGGDEPPRYVVTVDPACSDFVHVTDNGNGSFTARADLDDGYVVSEWSLSDGTTSTDEVFKFTPKTDVTVSVTVVQDPDYVTVKTYATTGGSVSDGVFVRKGTEVTLTATPREGYVFDRWVNGKGVEECSNPVYTFTASKDVELTAEFSLDTVTVTVEYTAIGWDDEMFEVSYGGSFTYTVSDVHPGYDFIGWRVAGSSEIHSSPVISLSDLKDDVTVTVIFQLIPADTVVSVTCGSETKEVTGHKVGDVFDIAFRDLGFSQTLDSEHTVLWSGDIVGDSISVKATDPHMELAAEIVPATVTVKLYTKIDYSETLKTTYNPSFGDYLTLDSYKPDGTEFKGYFDADGNEVERTFRVMSTDTIIIYACFEITEYSDVSVSLDTSSSEAPSVTVSVKYMTGIAMFQVTPVVDGVEQSAELVTTGSYVWSQSFDSICKLQLKIFVRYSDMTVYDETASYHLRHLSWNYRLSDGDLSQLPSKTTVSNNASASVYIEIPQDVYDEYEQSTIARSQNWDGYEEFTRSNSVIRDIANKLVKITDGYCEIDVLNCILKMCQSVSYAYDSKGDFYADGALDYWNFPVETLWDMKGDCEDHAFLFAAVTRELGYHVACSYITTDAGGHMAAYIASEELDKIFADYTVQTDGYGQSYYSYGTVADYHFFKESGRMYYYAESTPDLVDNPGKSTVNSYNLGYIPSGYRIYTNASGEPERMRIIC